MSSEWITINPASLYDLLIFTISAALTFDFYAAFLKLGRRRLDLIFANTLLFTTVYSFATLMSDNATSGLPSLRWARVIYICTALTLVSIVHFTVELAGKRTRRWNRLIFGLYLTVPLLMVATHHPLFLRVRVQPSGPRSWMNVSPWLPEAGPLVWLFLGYCLVLWLIVTAVCVRAFKSPQKIEGTIYHLKMLFVGLTVLMISGFLSGILMAYSIYTIDFTMLGFMAICLTAAKGLARQMLQKERLKDAMSKYVSQSVTDEIVENGLLTRGESRDVTILFTDIRDFAALSENIPPEAVVGILNRYFDVVARTVFEHGGMFNKIIGDGALAIFGAPQMLENHALSGVRAAMQMQTALEVLNDAFIKEGLTPLCVGMGLHSGQVVIGNVGGETHIEYTAIGDVVNVASRVEQHTKVARCAILVTGETYRRVKAFVPARMAGEAPIRPGERSVAVFEITFSRKPPAKASAAAELR